MDEGTILGSLATLASAWEVQTGPKPGLVDPFSCGAHDDMDYVTFLASISALSPYWSQQARIGLDGTPPARAMERLRPVGLEMERAMARATGGVNTHKGLIFALSLLLFGAGSGLRRSGRVDPGEAAELAASAVAESVRAEFDHLSRSGLPAARTHGETLFLKHGITGIRGEAASGFPSVIEQGLPALKQALQSGASLQDAALHAFFAIAAVCEDSNVISRGGFDFWRETHLPRMRALSEPLPPYSPGFIQGLQALDAEYASLRISPGGAADLLSCTLFLNWAQLVNMARLS
ncbi:MAG: triphosphoribosyl-dephospho-CoA synthase [Synergistaceae bacterium]|nr:triphosphoribosyl-dephospho-CoA synthase [Synergistaceae bacterium]